MNIKNIMDSVLIYSLNNDLKNADVIVGMVLNRVCKICELTDTEINFSITDVIKDLCGDIETESCVLIRAIADTKHDYYFDIVESKEIYRQVDKYIIKLLEKEFYSDYKIDLNKYINMPKVLFQNKISGIKDLINLYQNKWVNGNG